ncbi:MAG: DUF423 domain-containing protein [Trueperaceae bacterium]|nr:DUF423 domain-containing protein [Trueperaceae bacterium]
MQRTLSPSRQLSLHPAQLGAILAFLAVALGAFGAHGLKGILSPDRLATYETAVRYQMYHALALLVIGALPKVTYRAAPVLFVGVLVFSGSLYLLVATNLSWLGAVAPIGGVLMLVGWLMLFFRLFRLER